MNSRLCGSYCLYLFYLIERMTLYDTILKLVFENLQLYDYMSTYKYNSISIDLTK